jgi:cytochrome c
MRRSVLLVLAATLAACGQPKPADTSAPPVAVATVPAPAAFSPEVIATRIAALPAPYNQGDYAKGKTMFGQCRSCHTLDAGGPNRVGPNLHGVLGRTAGTVESFKTYSKALKESAIVWNAENMDKWIANPREVVPVNNMIFPGVRKEEDRRNLIAYIAVETAD